MRLRYEWSGSREVDKYWWVDFWKVIGPSGLKVVGYRYGPWRWYRGEDGEYIWTGGEWEMRGEVRKWTDVPLHHLCLSKTRSSPPLVLSHINLHFSSELSSCIFVTLVILAFIFHPYLHQKSLMLLLSDTSTLVHHLSDYPVIIHIIPAL
jgi:hypothetical protein